MKKILLFFAFVFLYTYSFSQEKTSLLSEIKSFKLEKVRNHKYDLNVYFLIDSIKKMTEKDYVIVNTTKEYLKGKASGKIKMNKNVRFETNYLLEVKISSKSPYSVIFYQFKERRSVNTQTKVESDWKQSSINSDDYYIKLYEMIEGRIELPINLKKKVDAFNKKQPSDKIKIIEGRDY